MKKLVLLCALMVCFAGVASAQDDMSKVDVFAGYSFAHLSSDGFGINFNGGSASGAYNIKPWLGLVADFGGYHTDTDGESGNLFTYLFGPRINFHRGKMTPFVQALFGGGHLTGGESCSEARVHTQATSGCDDSFSENAFSMTLGGGLDYNLTSRIAFRVAQIEYFMTDFGNTTQNGVRISTGVVVRF